MSTADDAIKYSPHRIETTAVGECPKCGVNRFKAPCPYSYQRLDNCPMYGTPHATVDRSVLSTKEK